jgi:hypothetical protein
VTLDELKVWAENRKTYDHLHYCGNRVTVADVKKAVRDLLKEQKRT